MRHTHSVEVHGPVIRVSIGHVGQISLIVVIGTRTTSPVSMLFSLYKPSKFMELKAGNFVFM
jgi:hypothetical protein